MSPKRKLAQFAELETFPNVLQVTYDQVSNKAHGNRGKWSEAVFKNKNAIVLELGCGKGEYTVGMAAAYPSVNFIGVDVKGARIWRGAKTALESNLPNATFLRTRIEFIDSFFAPGEVSDIWITFPDPQPRSSKEKKRLTSPSFLKKYLSILKDKGAMHLKTDNRGLFEYSIGSAMESGLTIEIATESLHRDLPSLEISAEEKKLLEIPTHYETIFRKKGLEICYLRMAHKR